MKLVLGMEVGLSPGEFVLDVDPVPFPEKGAEPPLPIFGPFLFYFPRMGPAYSDPYAEAFL